MLYIRVDGNPTIGTGHVMRCLSIADAVRLRGEETTFIVADDNMVSLLSERGYPVIVLGSTWNDMESEMTTITSLIRRHTIKKIMIDSYYVTPAYLQKLCELAYVIYIDDLNKFRYPCHMLINYNCYYRKFNYPMYYSNTTLLLGCHYAPLRGEFQNLPRRILQSDVKSVLITTGGNDPRNIAGKLVTMAKETQELKDLVFHIIAGRFNPHINELKHIAAAHKGVIIHSPVQSMSELMMACDIAVSAGGSTLYELCACGTPTVAFSLADNQVDGVTCFGNGLMINAGDIRENGELCLKRIRDGINHLRRDYQLCLGLSEKTQNLVDGQGVWRIAEKLCSTTIHIHR